MQSFKISTHNLYVVFEPLRIHIFLLPIPTCFTRISPSVKDKKKKGLNIFINMYIVRGGRLHNFILFVFSLSYLPS